MKLGFSSAVALISLEQSESASASAYGSVVVENKCGIEGEALLLLRG